MPESIRDSFPDFVIDQLRALEELECRSMFGGYGLYLGEVFFGILFKGRLYFKTGEASRPKYVEKGMKPFRPSAKQTLKSYYEVPIEVLEDHDALVAWAHEAAAVDGRRPACRGKTFERSGR